MLRFARLLICLFQTFVGGFDTVIYISALYARFLVAPSFPTAPK